MMLASKIHIQDDTGPGIGCIRRNSVRSIPRIPWDATRPVHGGASPREEDMAGLRCELFASPMRSAHFVPPQMPQQTGCDNALLATAPIAASEPPAAPRGRLEPGQEEEEEEKEERS